jgi:hypothetical protein
MCNSLWFSGEKGVSDDEVEALLDRIMILFKFLNGKVCRQLLA